MCVVGHNVWAMRRRSVACGSGKDRCHEMHRMRHVWAGVPYGSHTHGRGLTYRGLVSGLIMCFADHFFMGRLLFYMQVLQLSVGCSIFADISR